MRPKYRQIVSIAIFAFLHNAVFALPTEAASDPADYSWIKTWAAVGDSFTAGIGTL
jgi:hypothetical protein